MSEHCFVLTSWTAHLDALASVLRGLGHDPVILRGGMGAKDRTAALARLHPQPGGPPLLASSPHPSPSAPPGYTSLGFPDPRKHPYTPSADAVLQAGPEEPSA
jgi:hypothetical protein